MYRIDDDSAFYSYKSYAAYDAAQKRKHDSVENSWTKVLRPAIESSMMAVCQHDHFTKTMQPCTFYSLRHDSDATLQTLAEFFDVSATGAALAKRKRNAGMQHGMRLDVSADVDSIHPDGNVYFRMGMTKLGFKRTMKVAPGMGRRRWFLLYQRSIC